MKKTVISASIAAMIGGLGLAGVANAAIVYNTNAPALNVQAASAAASTGRDGQTVVAAASAITASGASALALNNNDVGNILIVPYFTTNGTNASLLNITNTDRVNGKLVKVRYRGASNSDDLLDFTLLMSPGDVWTANVSKGADGVSVLKTSDTTCTIPTLPAAGQRFGTGRLNPALTGDTQAAETREGYIEMLVMANIPQPSNLNQYAPTAVIAENPLFTAVKHVNGVPPCAANPRSAATTAAFNALNTDVTNVIPYYDLTAVNGNAAGAARVDTTTARGKGLDFPTGGLMANWIIIDTVKTATFSGTATALESRDGANAAAAGNIVFFPQMNVPYNVAGVAASVDAFTADPLLQTTNTNIVRFNGVDGSRLNGSGVPYITPQFSDLPDLSTPYVANNTTAVSPRTFAHAVTTLLASTSTVNEYMTTASIGATTDWVFSMPTRRYSIAMNYAHTGLRDGRIRTYLQNAAAATDEFFTYDSTVVVGGRICALADIVDGMVHWDREEQTLGTVPGFSPGDFTRVRFCGEAAVIGFNNPGATTSGSLSSSLAYQGVTMGWSEGWARIMHQGVSATTAAANPSMGTFATANKGLPVMGAAYIKSSSFGAMWTHRSGI